MATDACGRCASVRPSRMVSGSRKPVLETAPRQNSFEAVFLWSVGIALSIPIARARRLTPTRGLSSLPRIPRNASSKPLNASRHCPVTRFLGAVNATKDTLRSLLNAQLERETAEIPIAETNQRPVSPSSPNRREELGLPRGGFFLASRIPR